MKKSELKNKILSVIRESQEIKEAKAEIKDELGKFFIVTKPLTKKPTKDDILVELDLLGFFNQIQGGLTKEEIKNSAGDD
jgi:hypothetical protein